MGKLDESLLSVMLTFTMVAAIDGSEPAANPTQKCASLLQHLTTRDGTTALSPYLQMPRSPRTSGWTHRSAIEDGRAAKSQLDFLQRKV